MDNKNLVAEIAARAGTKKGKVEDVLDALRKTIGDRLALGESVSVPRFGTFEAGAADPPDGGSAGAPMFTAATELTTRMIAQHPIAKSGKAGKLSGAKAAKDQRGKPPAVKATAAAAKPTAKTPTAKAPTAKKPTAKKAALRPRPS